MQVLRIETLQLDLPVSSVHRTCLQVRARSKPTSQKSAPTDKAADPGLTRREEAAPSKTATRPEKPALSMLQRGCN